MAILAVKVGPPIHTSAAESLNVENLKALVAFTRRPKQIFGLNLDDAKLYQNRLKTVPADPKAQSLAS